MPGLLDPFTGPGSTPTRRRFWTQVAQAVNASRKLAGRNATVDEHPGKGSVINFPDRRGAAAGGGGGGTCPDSVFLITATDLGICSDCFPGAGGTASMSVEQVGDISANSIELFPIGGTYGPLPSENDCLFGFSYSDTNGVLQHRYATSDCTGAQLDETFLPTSYFVARISGIWYGVVFTIPCSFVCPAVFYGVGTEDISDPITNLVSCSNSPFVNSDPFYDWFISHVMMGWDTVSLQVAEAGDGDCCSASFMSGVSATSCEACYESQRITCEDDFGGVLFRQCGCFFSDPNYNCNSVCCFPDVPEGCTCPECDGSC